MLIAWTVHGDRWVKWKSTKNSGSIKFLILRNWAFSFKNFKFQFNFINPQITNYITYKVLQNSKWNLRFYSTVWKWSCYWSDSAFIFFSPKKALDQLFSTFLMLRPFNTIHVGVTTTIKLFHCFFIIYVLDCNIKICFLKVLGNPYERAIWPAMGMRPTGWESML